LHPVVQVDGESLMLMTQLIALVPVDELRRPVLSLDSDHDEVTRALDLLADRVLTGAPLPSPVRVCHTPLFAPLFAPWFAPWKVRSCAAAAAARSTGG